MSESEPQATNPDSIGAYIAEVEAVEPANGNVVSLADAARERRAMEASGELKFLEDQEKMILAELAKLSPGRQGLIREAVVRIDWALQPYEGEVGYYAMSVMAIRLAKIRARSK